MLLQKTRLCGRTLNEVMRLYETGKLKSISPTIYPHSKIEEALRCLQQGKSISHLSFGNVFCFCFVLSCCLILADIGKLVLSHEKFDDVIRVVHKPRKTTLSPNGVYHSYLTSNFFVYCSFLSLTYAKDIFWLEEWEALVVPLRAGQQVKGSNTSFVLTGVVITLQLPNNWYYKSNSVKILIFFYIKKIDELLPCAPSRYTLSCRSCRRGKLGATSKNF
jgi:hypothetical protein